MEDCFTRQAGRGKERRRIDLIRFYGFQFLLQSSNDKRKGEDRDILQLKI